MLAKICSYSNFGPLSPNLTWVFTYGNSIANFRVARYRKIGNPEIGNTAVVGENPFQIRIQWPKITIWTNFRQHNYPISLICKIYRSANYRISAFFNKPWVTNLATLQKPWVLRKNWFYFWILHKKVDQNQWFETSFGVFKYEKNLKNKKFFRKMSFFRYFANLNGQYLKNGWSDFQFLFF